jgi:hypothetical protein
MAKTRHASARCPPCQRDRVDQPPSSPVTPVAAPPTLMPALKSSFVLTRLHIAMHEGITA